MSRRTALTQAFWQEFMPEPGIPYDVVAFGDGPAMATELAALVVEGTKRATASLLRDYADGKAPPRVGDFAVVVDGSGKPCCIFRTTEVRIGPLMTVDERFAWDEGEGERTRAWWLEAHRGYFGRQARREGFEMRDDIETVFERFEVVWPLSIADQGRSAGDGS